MRLPSLLGFILLLSPLISKSQNYIAGKIFDTQTNNPIEYATVYINGTTIGTISNSEGYFKLEHVKPPCTLVISHIGYETFSSYLRNTDYPELEFILNPKDVFIHEIFISDRNLRKENLEIFRADFLGTDVWGKYATIENEDAIYFTKEYERREIEAEDRQIPFFLLDNKHEIEWSDDSTIIYYPKLINIKVSAREPLLVNLPLLGYKLYVDLISFNHEFITKIKPERCSYLGYFYFKPVQPESKRDSIRIMKNRSKVYFNSPQHFFRALFANQLHENGYSFNEIMIDRSTTSVNFDSLIIRENDDAAIIGAENKKYLISYFSNYRGKPINLTEKKGFEPSTSTLLFMSDTCKFRKDGTLPETTMLLGGALGIKKVGAMLPDDYQ